MFLPDLTVNRKGCARCYSSRPRAGDPVACLPLLSTLGYTKNGEGPYLVTTKVYKGGLTFPVRAKDLWVLIIHA